MSKQRPNKAFEPDAVASALRALLRAAQRRREAAYVTL